VSEVDPKLPPLSAKPNHLAPSCHAAVFFGLAAKQPNCKFGQLPKIWLMHCTMMLCDVWTQRTTVYKDCYCSSHLSSARHWNVVKIKMHNCTKFPVFCVTWFTAIFSYTYQFSRKCWNLCAIYGRKFSHLCAFPALPKSSRNLVKQAGCLEKKSALGLVRRHCT